jgi:hypothetical protein
MPMLPLRRRTEVVLRWRSRSSRRSGYALAGANEWKAGVCKKPRVSCRYCSHLAGDPP